MDGEQRRDQILATVAKLYSANGWDPSVTDVAGAIGLSRTTTFYHLSILRGQGHVVCGPRGGWRLQPVDPPQDPAEDE